MKYYFHRHVVLGIKINERDLFLSPVAFIFSYYLYALSAPFAR